MKFRFSGSQRFMLSCLCGFLLLANGMSRAENVSLQRAITLALQNSTAAGSAHADVQRAFASYRELRNNYIPQLSVGSGLGYSYGFPLTLEGGAPSLVTVVAQNSIFNPSQRQLIRATKAEWNAAKLQDKDQREALIQDVAISYAELAKWQMRIGRLQEAEAYAVQMQKAVGERLQEGVDSTVDLKKAKLETARVQVHLAEARGAEDTLRRHLSHLTGLPLSSLEIDAQSIPPMPLLSTEDDLVAKALASSPAIKAADQHAIAETFRASSEHRALLPSMDFAAQYARFATFNNYDVFYRNFQPNNATFGLSIRFPFFNAPQKARAEAADADAHKAKQQAAAARNQVTEETAKLQNAVNQLDATRNFAQLDYELAQSNLEAVQTRINAGTATLHELADARVQANEKFVVFQDSDLEYERARLNLMRAAGDLESWALTSGSVQKP